jgi:hypothetical protein
MINLTGKNITLNLNGKTNRYPVGIEREKPLRERRGRD